MDIISKIFVVFAGVMGLIIAIIIFGFAVPRLEGYAAVGLFFMGVICAIVPCVVYDVLHNKGKSK